MSFDSSKSVIIPAAPRPEGSPLANVKHIIAVGSGKGGVGKSTTAVNLAMALKKLGAKVGLMDADIYGPSLPKLMGARQQPVESPDGKIAPPEAFGIKCMSMGMLGGNTPAVWRGPMASRAVQQFFSEIDWGELDYLIIDMPPGTGDIHITLAQTVRLSGAVVVMTPQGLAEEIARKGLKMFQQVRVPVIGLVENMSEYICPKCGNHDHIFSSGGGEAVAKELELPLLQKFPIDKRLMDASDAGIPLLESDPESSISKAYIELAQNMASELSAMLSGARKSKPIIVNTELNKQHKMLKVSWNDGRDSLVSFKDLRFYCPCAHCVDEHSGVRKIKKDDITDDVEPTRINTIGNYALGIHFSDGHNTGIFGFDYLRKILVKNEDAPSAQP